MHDSGFRMQNAGSYAASGIWYPASGIRLRQGFGGQV